MMTSARLLAVVAALGCLTAAGVAGADTTATSTISQMKIVESGDDNHRLFHGAVWLEYDKAAHNYRWGGAHCGNAGLSEVSVSMLFAAFRSRYSVALDYKVHTFRKQRYRCITGFTITRG
jgi:hypothetical protein